MVTNCIIPARGGSKRIPKKNIKDFLGEPIISYPITEAIKSKIFDNVIVSTDDAQIGMIAQEYGAGVHWRSEENSNDGAMLADVLLEVLVEKPCDIVCCLLPCSPLIDWSALWLANSMLKDHNAVVPVVKYSQPYQRALRVGENGVSMLDPSKYNVRSQDLDPVYYDPGCFWFLKVPAFLEYKMLYPPDSVPFIMSELNVQDVDTVEDWEMLELKYVRNRNNR